MYFFDTHIHLADFKNIKKDCLIACLHQKGIEKCVCVSSHVSDWEKVADFARSYPFDVVPAFGLHPWYGEEYFLDFKQNLISYIEMFPDAAIGECGFDRIKGVDFDTQKKIFEAQVEVSFEYNRPLIVHAVKADMWLQDYYGMLPQKTIFHSFSGSVEIVKKLFKYGFYVSVNHKFLNKKDYRKILENTPIEKLLIETDAPFQSEIDELSDLVQKISDIYSINVDEVAQKLYLNAMEIFVND